MNYLCHSCHLNRFLSECTVSERCKAKERNRQIPERRREYIKESTHPRRLIPALTVNRSRAQQPAFLLFAFVPSPSVAGAYWLLFNVVQRRFSSLWEKSQNYVCTLCSHIFMFLHWCWSNTMITRSFYQLISEGKSRVLGFRASRRRRHGHRT